MAASLPIRGPSVWLTVLATALITGVDIPPGYLARADAWRRKHEAATAAREGVGDG